MVHGGVAGIEDIAMVQQLIHLGGVQGHIQHRKAGLEVFAMGHQGQLHVGVGHAGTAMMETTAFSRKAWMPVRRPGPLSAPMYSAAVTPAMLPSEPPRQGDQQHGRRCRPKR